MSEYRASGTRDSRQLTAGIAFALSRRRNLGLEATVLRIIRITLLALVPMVAIGTIAAGCGDDTTTAVGADMSVVHDLATPIVVHDIALPPTD
jgi:hypothetical protein